MASAGLKKKKNQATKYSVLLREFFKLSFLNKAIFKFGMLFQIE